MVHSVEKNSCCKGKHRRPWYNIALVSNWPTTAEVSLTFLTGGQRPADGQTTWAKAPATVRAHLSFHNIVPLLCNNYPFSQALQGWLNFSILRTKTSLTLHKSHKQLASYFLWQR